MCVRGGIAKHMRSSVSSDVCYVQYVHLLPYTSLVQIILMYMLQLELL